MMNKESFVDEVRKALQGKEKHNKLTLEKMGLRYGIKDKNLVKELVELAIVLEARSLAHQPGKSVSEKYDDIVQLYKSQVNLSHRTSQSVLLQQYSTPAPIGYLMGVYCGIDKPGRYFEPSAGNGLLTIAANPFDFVVNEIDKVRKDNLLQQDFSEFGNIDASGLLPFKKEFDAVLTNPPFGKLDDDVIMDGYAMKDLDHVMAIRALDCMKDNGRAAIIIGGHTTWDDHGRVKQGKNRMFFNYLNKFYNVLDVVLIDGHALYSRQGTSFDTRLILIDGRKETPGGVAPLKTDKDVVVTTFDELYNRVMAFTKHEQTLKPSMKLKLKSKAKAVKANLRLQSLNGVIKDTHGLENIFKTNAIPFRFVKFNEKNFINEFGTTGELTTPIGTVAVSYDDFDKMERKVRQSFFGLIQPTLTKPLIIVHHRERQLFIKTFLNRENETLYFVSVALDESGYFSLSSNHTKDRNSIFKKIREGNVIYQTDSFKTALGDPDTSPKYYISLEIGLPFRSKVINKSANSEEDLGMPYIPASQMCNSLDVDTPDSMSYEIHLALKKLKLIVGNVEQYVQKKLGYASHEELCDALSAEQADAVAMAIYNIEQRGQALIVGDQTGIGKGRIAAAMVRYGCKIRCN